MATFSGIAFFIVNLFLAFILCFFGYRYVRKLIMAYGFLFGFLAAFLLLAPVTGLSTVLALVFSILIGVGVCLLVYFLYHVGIFLMGASFGALIGWAILVLFGGSVTTTFGIIFICVFAVALGSLTIVYRRAFLIFSTSFNGASSLALYGGYFFLHLSSIFSAQAGTASQTLRSLSRAVTAFQQTHAQWLLLATLVLAILGILIQFTKTAPRKKSK